MRVMLRIKRVIDAATIVVSLVESIMMIVMLLIIMTMLRIDNAIL